MAFQKFVAEVEDTLSGHAKRKGYSEGSPNGPNQLAEFTKHIGALPGHVIGEIVYKATEWMKSPRKVLLVKIAAWAFVLWRFYDEDDMVA